MKKIVIFLFAIILLVIISGAIFFWQYRTHNYSGPIGPGLPGECFMVFKINGNNQYAGLVMGILDTDTAYNNVTKQSGGESIFPYFQIKKASNGYYYGWLKVCFFNPEIFSNNERAVLLKENVGNYFTENGIMLTKNPKPVIKSDVVYDNIEFSEFYYCHCSGKCTEEHILQIIRDDKVTEGCSKSF